MRLTGIKIPELETTTFDTVGRQILCKQRHKTFFADIKWPNRRGGSFYVCMAIGTRKNKTSTCWPWIKRGRRHQPEKCHRIPRSFWPWSFPPQHGYNYAITIDQGSAVSRCLRMKLSNLHGYARTGLVGCQQLVHLCCCMVEQTQ